MTMKIAWAALAGALGRFVYVRMYPKGEPE